MNLIIIASTVAIVSLANAVPIMTHHPANPHAFFNRTGGCDGCHSISPKNRSLREHEFAGAISENCVSCHPQDSLGLSHPVAVSKKRHYPDMVIPENLPLDEEDNITCGTCHNPHLQGFSTRRFGLGDDPLFQICQNDRCTAYFKTYYLRVEGNGDGYTPLCQSCHAAY